MKPRRAAVVVVSAGLLAPLLSTAALAHPAYLAHAAHPQPRTDPVVAVAGAGGRVVIHERPFRLEVRNRAGRTVLAESTQHPAPTPYAATTSTPLGSTDGQRAPIYAPMTFTVGAAHQATYPGSPWEGNLLVGAAAGVQYSARDVTAVARITHGVRLTVSTDDLTGRTLDVAVTSDGPRFVVDARLSHGSAALLADAFTSPGREAFHGFGGRHDGIDHHGQTFDTWVQEEDFGAGPAQPVAGGTPGTGGASYLFPSGPSAAYYVQPQLISSRGYGFRLDQDELAQWRMDSDQTHAWTVRAAASHLRYVVAPGSLSHDIGALTAQTGRQRVPPSWALGPQLDRLIYTNDTASGYYAKVLDDLTRIRQTHLPLTGYRIEGWAKLTTTQLKGVIARLHRMHIHALLYFRAYASPDKGGTEQPAVFSDALRHGWFSTTAAGAPYLFSTPFGAPGGLIDVTNPAAARWFAARITAGLDLGADGFMSDFGEQVQPDMHFADGSTGATMHNRYPVLYQRLVRRAVTAYEHLHPHRHIFFYNRTGYSGSARYESANFPGDETTDFSQASGLASLTDDMLGRAVGGAYGYTTDIGGYEDVTTGATTKELFLRWAEWAALSPLFRDHGSADSGTHTPYSYDSQTLHTYIALSRLHERAEPLIRRLWHRADRTGVPVTRPLWLAYPHDAAARRQQQEWLLGPDVLVAPVVTQGAASRRVYLPAGCWAWHGGNRHLTGHRYVTSHASLTTLPWFTRCGHHPLRRA